MEQIMDFVRYKDVMNYFICPDILMLGMMYENRTVMEQYCSGIMLKVM